MPQRGPVQGESQEQIPAVHTPLREQSNDVSHGTVPLIIVAIAVCCSMNTARWIMVTENQWPTCRRTQNGYWFLPMKILERFRNDGGIPGLRLRPRLYYSTAAALDGSITKRISIRSYPPYEQRNANCASNCWSGPVSQRLQAHCHDQQCERLLLCPSHLSGLGHW